MEQYQRFQNQLVANLKALKDNTNLTILKNNILGRVVLLLALSSSSYSFTVTIYDTGFCPKDLKLKNKNIEILPTIDYTKSVKIDCNSNVSNQRLHGQNVAQTFIDNLNVKGRIKIRPTIVFDSAKKQSARYWHRAFSDSNISNIAIIAAGLPFEGVAPNIPMRTNTIFVSQGKYGRGIKKDHKLWPQEVAKKFSNIIIIGGHYPRTKFDKGYPDKRALYKKEASYYFPDRDENINFTGSSYSVAYAAAKAINLCYRKRIKMEHCLDLAKKELDWDYPLKVNTY